MKKSTDFLMEEILEDLLSDVGDDMIADYMIGMKCDLNAKAGGGRVAEPSKRIEATGMQSSFLPPSK